MGKRMLLMMTALVIAACGLLPGLISRWRDQRELDRVQYAPISNVQLQIQAEADGESASGMAMMGRMDGGIEISSAMASMTGEEAENRALAILGAYMDAGLVEAFTPVVSDLRCMLATVSGDPSLNGIFWIVTMVSGDDSNFHQFDIALHDSRGVALSLSYTCEDPMTDAQRDEKLLGFAQLYFQGLGVESYEPFLSRYEEVSPASSTAVALRYHYVDSVYGELEVLLYAYEHGFYTEFPDPGVKKK